MSENNDILLDIIMALHRRLIAPSVGLLQWIASREEKKKLQKAEQAPRFDLFYFFRVLLDNQLFKRRWL